MRNEQFLTLRDDLNTYCTALLETKKEEYSGDKDRLDQFFKASIMLNTSCQQALCGMMVKHITSIFDLANKTSLDTIIPLELWKEKICDARNYLDLLWAIVIEGELQPFLGGDTND